VSAGHRPRTRAKGIARAYRKCGATYTPEGAT
jgi:hypothetical protein